jgi:hypothetical protein
MGYRPGRRQQPIRPLLAAELLKAARPLVTQSTRNTLFAAPVTVPPQASPSDRLLAWLGRNRAAPLSRA